MDLAAISILEMVEPLDNIAEQHGDCQYTATGQSAFGMGDPHWLEGGLRQV